MGDARPERRSTPELVVDLPADIEQAALEIVTAMRRRKGRDGDLASVNLGAGSISYGEKHAIPVHRARAPRALPEAARLIMFADLFHNRAHLARFVSVNARGDEMHAAPLELPACR